MHSIGGSIAKATLAVSALLLAGCAHITVREDGSDELAATPSASPAVQTAAQTPAMSAVEQAKFEQDRRAILAMAGDYDVDFDFTETVAFAPGYRLKPAQLSGGHEVVRVIEDKGNVISLQHILVVEAGDHKMPIKHWRQDWVYEPASVLIFIGGNAWETQPVSGAEREGKWSQTVYQVEDSPRYGAVGAWSHDNGLSEWTGKAEWRPLPRRDATERDDYQAVIAVNRHAITPDGWVHEQDNTKLALTGDKPQVLVREIGINTYRKYDKFNTAIATDYWRATKDFWALVRADWEKLEKEAPVFGLTVQGEPEPLYQPLLKLANEVQAGKKTAAAAATEATAVIQKFTTRNVGTLAERLAAPKT